MAAHAGSERPQAAGRKGKQAEWKSYCRFSLSCVAAERFSVLGLVEDWLVEQAQEPEPEAILSLALSSPCPVADVHLSVTPPSSGCRLVSSVVHLLVPSLATKHSAGHWGYLDKLQRHSYIDISPPSWCRGWGGDVPCFLLAEHRIGELALLGGERNPRTAPRGGHFCRLRR